MKLTPEKIASLLGVKDFSSIEEASLPGQQIQDVASLSRCTSLRKLHLQGNRFQVWRQIEGIFYAPKLEYLDLSATPVSRLQKYREYVISHCSDTLQYLDTKPITPQERRKAQTEFPDARNKLKNLTSSGRTALPEKSKAGIDIFGSLESKKTKKATDSMSLFGDDSFSIPTNTSKYGSAKTNPAPSIFSSAGSKRPSTNKNIADSLFGDDIFSSSPKSPKGTNSPLNDIFSAPPKQEPKPPSPSPPSDDGDLSDDIDIDNIEVPDDIFGDEEDIELSEEGVPSATLTEPLPVKDEPEGPAHDSKFDLDTPIAKPKSSLLAGFEDQLFGSSGTSKGNSLFGDDDDLFSSNKKLTTTKSKTSADDLFGDSMFTASSKQSDVTRKTETSELETISTVEEKPLPQTEDPIALSDVAVTPAGPTELEETQNSQSKETDDLTQDLPVEELSLVRSEDDSNERETAPETREETNTHEERLPPNEGALDSEEVPGNSESTSFEEQPSGTIEITEELDETSPNTLEGGSNQIESVEKDVVTIEETHSQEEGAEETIEEIPKELVSTDPEETNQETPKEVVSTDPEEIEAQTISKAEEQEEAAKSSFIPAEINRVEKEDQHSSFSLGNHRNYKTVIEESATRCFHGNGIRSCVLFSVMDDSEVSFIVEVTESNTWKLCDADESEYDCTVDCESLGKLLGCFSGSIPFAEALLDETMSTDDPIRLLAFLTAFHFSPTIRPVSNESKHSENAAISQDQQQQPEIVEEVIEEQGVHTETVAQEQDVEEQQEARSQTVHPGEENKWGDWHKMHNELPDLVSLLIRKFGESYKRPELPKYPFHFVLKITGEHGDAKGKVYFVKVSLLKSEVVVSPCGDDDNGDCCIACSASSLEGVLNGTTSISMALMVGLLLPQDGLDYLHYFSEAFDFTSSPVSVANSTPSTLETNSPTVFVRTVTNQPKPVKQMSTDSILFE